MDSPGLKALKTRNANEVRKKVIELENKKIKRKMVSLSPNKLRAKRISMSMQSKITRYADKMSVDKSEIVKKDKKSDKKLEMMKEIIDKTIKRKEEADHDKNVEPEDTACRVIDSKDAFELILETAKGGIKTPSLPAKYKRRKQVFKTPIKKDRDIREWIGKE